MMHFLKQVTGEVQAGAESHHLTPDVLFARLCLAFALGGLAAAVHRVTCGGGDRGPDRPFMATLVLLSVLISLVTLAIGDSVARAFSLVGTLAIVRFRTVVEDTRDTAFVIYAVAAGLCVGSGYLMGPIVAAPLVLLAAWIFRNPARSASSAGGEGELVLRLAAGRAPDGPVQAVLAEHVSSYRLTALSTARGGAALDVTYAIRLPGPEQLFDLVNALGRVEGVQSVELKGD